MFVYLHSLYSFLFSLILSIFSPVGSYRNGKTSKIKITPFSAIVSRNGLNLYEDVLNDLYICKYIVFCECDIKNNSGDKIEFRNSSNLSLRFLALFLTNKCHLK